MGKYNMLTKELIYMNAGHIPPILIHEDNAELLEKGCTLLGVFEELPKRVEFGTKILHPNTTIISFTDGLTELENSNEEQFGTERLLQFTKINHRLSPEVFNKMLYDYICKFKGNVLFNDDISVLTGKFF
jgi:sigma-B regulation protein RsbU (phosphoserine phosphatase)